MRKDGNRILGCCDLCNETIYQEDTHYEMPDGDLICEECMPEWAAQYRVMGVIDLAN